jgi:hypothetical protein
LTCRLLLFQIDNIKLVHCQFITFPNCLKKYYFNEFLLHHASHTIKTVTPLTTSTAVASLVMLFTNQLMDTNVNMSVTPDIEKHIIGSCLYVQMD